MIWRIMLLMLIAPVLVYAQDLTRIGGYIGGGYSRPTSAEARSESSPDFIRISQLSAKMIKTLFDTQISLMYVKDNTGAVWQTSRHVFGKTWGKAAVPYGPQKTSIYIVQHIDGSKYLAKKGDSWFMIDLGRDGYVDGQRVDDLILEKAEATYQYTSVLGAKNTVSVMQIRKESPIFTPLSFQDFNDALKKGITFDILFDSYVTCMDCKGTGSLKERNQKGASNANTASYRSLICSRCKSQGKIKSALLYRLSN